MEQMKEKVQKVKYCASETNPQRLARVAKRDETADEKEQ
jgi:hypothetical protein